MTPRLLVPVERPDGRIYRPRKPPVAVVVPDHHDDPAWIYVLRTHDVDWALALATELADREQLDIMSAAGSRDWIRDGMRWGERAYVFDQVHGVPTVVFSLDI